MGKLQLENKRNSYYDFIKGVAIMGVVAIHTLKFNYEPYSIGGFLVVLFRNLLGCCVPFFVAVSGYFLCNKNINSKEAYFSFMRNRIRVIYIPLLVWGVPWLFLQYLQVDSFIKVLYVTLMYFIGGLSINYFIILIIELYVQLPVIQKVNKGGVILLAVLSIIVTYGWSLILYSSNVQLPLVAYCSFPTYIGFFALGCYLGKNKVSPNIWLSFTIIIIGLIFAVYESYFWLEYNPKNNWLGLKASVQFLAFGVILLLFSESLNVRYQTNSISRIIEWFGKQTMPIYLSHMLMYMILKKINVIPDLWIMNCFFVFSFDVILIIFLTKILPQKVLLCLGIR